MKNTKEFYNNRSFAGYTVNNLYHGLCLVKYNVDIKNFYYYLDYKHFWLIDSTENSSINL